MKHRNPHGGKRLGAGRKHQNGHAGYVRKQINFKPSTVAALTRSGEPLGPQVRRIVEEWVRQRDATHDDRNRLIAEILGRFGVKWEWTRKKGGTD